MDRVMLRCLCCVKVHTNITAKAFINPLFLSLHELSRFIIEEQSEECAFSGQIDFSRIGKGKNREFSGYASLLLKKCRFSRKNQKVAE